MHATHGLFFLLLTLPTTSLPAQSDAPLDRYVGTWATEFQIVVPAATEPREPFRGEVVARRTVANRFVDQTGTYQLGGDSPLIIKTIMGYDPVGNTFPFSYFDSTGNRRQSTGQWDPDSETMTSQFAPEADGSVTVIVANFATPGVEIWSIETRDADGSTRMRIEGRNRLLDSDQRPSAGN